MKSEFEFIVFSKGILRIPHLNNFLGSNYIRRYHPYFLKINRKDTFVVEWGYKPVSRKAILFAEKLSLPRVTLEDGFLRSVGLGVEGNPPFSLVFDDLGIYYDPLKPSRLERLIFSNKSLSKEIFLKVDKAISLICENNLSKYNHAIDFTEKPSKKIILVVDQTVGDMAVIYGQANEDHFKMMLTTAIAENPCDEIWVKTHPDVISGKKEGYLTEFVSDFPNVKLLKDDFNSISLLKCVDKVYCVTSQMGFEALLLGKQVVTFGAAWFAGWGLTDDRHFYVEQLKSMGRREERSIHQIFNAAYLEYCRYINPYNGEKGDIFDVIYYLIRVKSIMKYISGNIYCIGMRFWKRNVVKPFFQFPNCNLYFVSELELFKKQTKNQSDIKIVVWGNNQADVVRYAKDKGIPLLRMEDGFIRSIGLGSNLTRPISLVIDDLGMYFDSNSISRLECILQSYNFGEDDLQQAEGIKNNLIDRNLGKYNVGSSLFNFENTNKLKILVVGQVEDDASIEYGSPVIKTNLELLKKVREKNLGAYILYKPHPDVVTGNRKGSIKENDVLIYADRLVESVNILDCINYVDEVHTITSLAGFEALLRGKKVYCYGLPFYSNWGLTIDYLSLQRRTRKLNLLELISGVLVYYPQYIHPETKQIISVEQAISILSFQKNKVRNIELSSSYFLNFFSKIKNLFKLLI